MIVETRIAGEGWIRSTWGDFVDANESMGPDEIADIDATLRRGRGYVGGGGAAPTFEVRIAQPDDACSFWLRQAGREATERGFGCSPFSAMSVEALAELDARQQDEDDADPPCSICAACRASNDCEVCGATDTDCAVDCPTRGLFGSYDPRSPELRRG